MRTRYYDYPTAAAEGAPPAGGDLTTLTDGRVAAVWANGFTEARGNSSLFVQFRDTETGEWSAPVTVATEFGNALYAQLKPEEGGGFSLIYGADIDRVHVTFDAAAVRIGDETRVEVSTGADVYDGVNTLRLDDGSFVVAITSLEQTREEDFTPIFDVVTTIQAFDAEGRPASDRQEILRIESEFFAPTDTTPALRQTSAGTFEVITVTEGDSIGGFPELNADSAAILTELDADLMPLGPEVRLPAVTGDRPKVYDSLTVTELDDGRTVYAWADQSTFVAYRAADGTMGPAMPILSRVARDVRQIAVEEVPGGGLLVLSAQDDFTGNRSQVYATLLDDEGGILDTLLLGQPKARGTGGADVAFDGEGRMIVRWAQINTDPFETQEIVFEVPDEGPLERLIPSGLSDTLGSESRFDIFLPEFNDRGIEISLLGGDDRFEGFFGPDLVRGGAGQDSLDGGDEADVIFGGLGNDTVIGGRGADTLNGDEGADQLRGGDDGDRLLGGAGLDTLDGGFGADTMIGGPGSDRFLVDDVGDRVGESRRWEGEDIVISSVDFRMGRQHIENLSLTGEAILGAGNGLQNEIRGNDQANILDGGKNNDTLIGGGNNDTYLVRAPGDLVIEAAGRGFADTVKAFRAYELTANVERLFLQTLRNDAGEGVAGINGIGNDLDNLIVGNPFDNVIAGRGGSDTLKGQAGADTFVFDRDPGAANVDRIIDFNSNEADEGDTLLFKGTLFGGQARGDLAAEAFALGTAAQDATDRFIFDQQGGRLWFDADGSGAAGQILVATFEQGATVTAADIDIF